MSVVILSHARTPIGSFLGALKSYTAPDLGALVLKAALEKINLKADKLDEVILGNVLSAGVGQAPARQAALKAGIPSSVPCLTINKVCGSGLKAVMLGTQSILLGESDFVAAGGMESMSNAPYLLTKARTGYRLGDQTTQDSILRDGLLDSYSNPNPNSKTHMGVFADACAKEFNFSREDQDRFAMSSYEKALKAQKNNLFDAEIIYLENLTQDEEPSRYKPEKFSKLKPVFDKLGTVTAANASKINDGAAALILAQEEAAQTNILKPMAKIISMATFAQDPKDFTTAPIEAIKIALEKAKLNSSDIDYFEINEAFSAVVMIAQKKLNILDNKLNIWGGAVALGHPIGASGARILCTLISVLEHKKSRYGCAAICLGGGEAVAMIIERL